MFFFLAVGLLMASFALVARLMWARTPEPPAGAFSQFEIYLFQMRRDFALSIIPYIIGFGLLLALASISAVVFGHRPMF